MKKALVVLSGGQDSATCAAWAATMFDYVHFITYDYGQRHAKEIDSAVKIAALFGRDNWTVVPVHALKDNPMSTLTSRLETMPFGGNFDTNPSTGLPFSFVPGRNLIFLTMAASYAISRGVFDIVTGVCQTDYSGYPDCRRDTIDKIESAILAGNLGAALRFKIHTPLMDLTKAETVRLAKRLPLGLDAVALSWTCYEGGQKACNVCPACVLRAKGFKESGFVDPAL